MSTEYGANTRAKLDRADEHLQVLYGELRAFVNADPYTILEDVQPDGSRILSAKVNAEPPLRFGLILGDALHNLHSALDNLIPDVIRASGRTPGGRATFPIYNNRESFEAHIRNRLRSVRRQHVERLEALQPHPERKDPEAASLGILNAYSNADKHAAIHPTFTIAITDPNELKIKGTPGEGVEEVEIECKVTWLRNKPLEDGAPFLHIGIRTTPDNAPINLNFSVPFGIAFGKSGLLAVGLPEIRRQIGAVIDRFIADFD